MPAKGYYIDLSGKRYGKLLVIRFIERKNLHSYFECLCDCGNICNVTSNNLRKGKQLSCGCLSSELTHKRFAKNPGESMAYHVYKVYKRGAYKRNYEFNLSFDKFKELTSKNCYYCNSVPTNKMERKGRNGCFIYNGLDRKDNNLGYSENNCVPCCWICNEMKKSKNYDEFITHINKIYINLNGGTRNSR